MTYNPEIWRDEFPHLLENAVYLNHAAISPLPKGTSDLVKNSLHLRQTKQIDDFEIIEMMVDKTRLQIAQLIGAKNIDQIAFVSNTTQGLNIIANGLPFHENDEILLHPDEFPTNVYPWLNQISRKVKLKFLPKDNGRLKADTIAQHITPKTRVVALSYIQFISGFKADLKAITNHCKDRDIFVVVDGIQGAGVVPVDVQETGIDAFCTGGHKWLMSPQGIGFMYLSDRLKDILRQTELGWLSVQEPWDFFNYEQDLKKSASRFETGMPNIPGIYGLCGSLNLLLRVGVHNIHAHVMKLGNELSRSLEENGFQVYTDLDSNHRSGITSFYLPENMSEEYVLKCFSDEKIFVSVRDKMIRFSPHLYNTKFDIERAAEVAIALKTVRV